METSDYQTIGKLNEELLEFLRSLNGIDLPEETRQRITLYISKVSHELQEVLLTQLQEEMA